MDAVITQLGLEQVLLAAHDASGPPPIDWVLAQPERVAGLVLLNTYYCEMPTLRPPEVQQARDEEALQPPRGDGSFHRLEDDGGANGPRGEERDSGERRWGSG